MSSRADSYVVRHHYRYEYTAPVSNVRQRLMMVPPDRHGDQVLTDFDLEVRGASGRVTTQWETDMFGNRVCRVEAERVDHAVDFEARFSVRREPATAPSTMHLCDRFLTFTPLTRPDERIQRVAQEIASAAESPRRRVSLAHDWTADAIEYRPGVTGTQTPAAMALHLGQGVCQDYAHILLALLRTLKIAARYVSGHLTGDGPPHAWVEALLPDSTVVGCDPTHQRDGDLNYIVVATGRDFADVTSTSGVFTGSATGKLHWSKHASHTRDRCAPPPPVSPRVQGAAPLENPRCSSAK